MRKLPRHFLVMIAVAALAFALSGCVIIKSNSSAQLDGIGTVQVTTTFCASDTNSDAGYSPPDSDCQGPTKGGNSDNDSSNAGAGTLQLLIAYRIPTNSTAPDAITTTNPGGGSAVTFTQSSSYASELESGSPAPSGQKWVGYVSTVQGYTEASASQYFTVAPNFTLQQEADGSPFTGPFNYRVAAGFRRVNGGSPASRPVDCGSSLTTIQNEGAGEQICVDSPTPAALTTSLQQPTQDLGILEPSTPETVKQGNVARVNFDAVFAGDGNPEPTFSLSTSTDVPDAEAMTNTPTLTPSEGSNPARVTFRAPVDTPPGTYYVTLTASLANGQVRSSTRELVVTPTMVRCDQLTPTIAGTRQDDVLKGTPGRDVIAGYAGNDRVVGLAGNDVICVGKGDDTVRGGNGNDRIAGRRGDDLLTGGRGHNLIRTGPGKDQFLQ